MFLSFILASHRPQFQFCYFPSSCRFDVIFISISSCVGTTWIPSECQPTALHRSRQPTWHPSNKCNPSNVTFFTNQGTRMTTEGKGLQSTMLGPLLEMICKHFSYQRQCGLLGVRTESILEHKVPSIPPQNDLVASTIQPKPKTYPSKLDQYLGWDK